MCGFGVFCDVVLVFSDAMYNLFFILSLRVERKESKTGLKSMRLVCAALIKRLQTVVCW